MSEVDESESGDEKSTFRQPWSAVESPCLDVVRTVAAVTDRETLALPPIDDTVDCDALQTLLEGGDADTALRLSFSYADTTVVIVRGEFIEVRLD